MDNRYMIADQLREAERHVALGEKHVARQYGLVSELERGGLNPMRIGRGSFSPASRRLRRSASGVAICWRRRCGALSASLP